MRIVQVHNYYQQPGGEDAVVAAERAQLEAHGHTVIPYYKDNRAIRPGHTRHLVRISLNTIWNHAIYREIRTLLRKEKPDIVHVHNTFPLISPALYWACAAEGVPVVQTIHNYRLLCLNSCLYRPPVHSVCELCVRRRWKWPGIRYGCYRGSRAGSATVAAMLLVHRLLGTWQRKVTRFIALTEFQRRKLIEGGLPADKIVLKPNAVDVSQTKLGDERTESYALYVGRLAPEKGVDTLIRAWAELPTVETQRLIIAGDGPERRALEELTRELGVQDGVEFVGRKDRTEVAHLMRRASFLVFPSVWYETFGLVILEAGLHSVPSLVATPGAAAELIEDAVSGYLVPAGDVAAWAEKMAWAFAHTDAVRETGRKARDRFADRYSPERNARTLETLYESVCVK